MYVVKNDLKGNTPCYLSSHTTSRPEVNNSSSSNFFSSFLFRKYENEWKILQHKYGMLILFTQIFLIWGFKTEPMQGMNIQQEGLQLKANCPLSDGFGEWVPVWRSPNEQV